MSLDETVEEEDLNDLLAVFGSSSAVVSTRPQPANVVELICFVDHPRNGVLYNFGRVCLDSLYA